MEPRHRVTALYTHCVRRLLAVPATGYYDDFQVGGPIYDQPSAQDSFGQFVDMFGPGFDDAKHVTYDKPAVNLGVLSDFSQVPSRAVVTLGVTEERKEKLRVMVRGVFADRAIRHAHNTHKPLSSLANLASPSAQSSGASGSASLAPCRTSRRDSP